MPGKSEVIATAKFTAGADAFKLGLEIDKAYKSALKFLSNAGIKMAPLKQPNNEILSGLMIQTKKPAQIVLSYEQKKAALVIQVAANKNTLGLCDLSKERDVEKQRAVLQSLVACGLADARELATFEAEHAKEADPKVVANLNRRIEQYKALKVAQAMGLPPVWADVLEKARASHTSESYEFLDAVKARTAAQTIFDTFIKRDSPKEVNLPAKIVADIAAAVPSGQVDFNPAANNIVAMLEKDAFKRYKEQKVAELNKQLEAMGA